jgi:hypothetical protein
MIQSMRVRWDRLLACMEEKRREEKRREEKRREEKRREEKRNAYRNFGRNTTRKHH